MLTLGIDDAGRGPVIGPMILSGCLLDSKVEKELTKLGVTDSKQLTQKRREILAGKIKETAEAFETTITSPLEIEETNKQGIKLNEVEAIKAAKIINKLNKVDKKIKVVIDCPSPNLSKWTDYLKTKIDNLSNLDISCEHKADKNHVSVSAASILAKTTREIEMDKIRKEYGKEVGSGYTSDPLTIKFLEKHAHKHHDSGIFRRTWATFKRAHSKGKQRTLV